MTPCTTERKPDFDALVRKGKELVALGMSGVVYCGSMGDWPLLTDEERMAGVERLIGAGVPVIVGTGAQNTPRRRGSGRARQALRRKGPDDHSTRAVARVRRRRRSARISRRCSTPRWICRP